MLQIIQKIFERKVVHNKNRMRTVKRCQENHKSEKNKKDLGEKRKKVDKNTYLPHFLSNCLFCFELNLPKNKNTTNKQDNKKEVRNYQKKHETKKCCKKQDIELQIKQLKTQSKNITKTRTRTKPHKKSLEKWKKTNNKKAFPIKKNNQTKRKKRN
ncbi:hypothetical protein RFI_09415 [Reticulomyxa filosa]|uniref:Uncharacterized protein n=1 Tax=Reticulomyxa filosa TaxID=46433 RepID=X6NP65_RETFI|nr:hypothetical protein RFI_09415 [Reticulomyxa filosa]|eukprot:ETO27718.1 hypothetical protein RFI_09415 [Reticulomyxa filosa]